MTDEDIIKSLECCSDIGRCCECPMWEMIGANCIVELNRLALGLIKRQQAELGSCHENIYDNPELLETAAKPAAKNIAQSTLAPATENFELMEG